MMALEAGIHKLLVRIANRANPYQTATNLQKQFDLVLPSMSRPFWQAASVKIFRTFTINI